MSALRVLLVGDHPNIALYASRFEAARSVEVCHVSNGGGSFGLETVAYGRVQVQMDNHFESLQLLEEMRRQKHAANGDGLFDLVIMSAASLQQISSTSKQLLPLVDSNTKIFVESTGFVKLEPFVRMSIGMPNLHVYSILSDFNIRQLKTDGNQPRQYKQLHDANVTNNIYIGSIQEPKRSPQDVSKYSSNELNMLKTFDKLFQKLFPRDNISFCNFSPIEFLAQQWAIAIPLICFDPLLILLGQTNPKDLPDQIIAKPLISGLVTETINVAKNMGCRLNKRLDNETSLLAAWQQSYADNALPLFVHHFMDQTAPSNIDLLLLQPILLADDYGIKTPYLEFLYTVLCQYEKFNKGESDLFTRCSKVSRELENLSNEKTQLQQTLEKIQQELVTKDKFYAEQTEAMKHQYESRLSGLQAEMNDMQLRTQQQQQQQQQLALKHSPTPQSSSSNIAENEYRPTGTPDLKDLEDIALYGVQYGVSSQPTIINDKRNSPTVSSVAVDNVQANAQALKEKELELRKKELELKERELEFQKKAAQRKDLPSQASPFYQQPMSYPHTRPTSTNRKTSSSIQLQQAVGIQSNRPLHGASTNPPVSINSASTFMDPVSFGNSHVLPNSVKPTSRKNRNSNMPMLRNASSLEFGSFMPQLPQQNSHSYPHLNSLSTMTSRPNKPVLPRASKSTNFTLSNDDPGLSNSRQISANNNYGPNKTAHAPDLSSTGPTGDTSFSQQSVKIHDMQKPAAKPEVPKFTFTTNDENAPPEEIEPVQEAQQTKPEKKKKAFGIFNKKKKNKD